MNKPIAVAIITGGIAILLYGLRASESFSSDLSRFFTGNPSDRSLWLMISGLAILVSGSVFYFRRSK